MKQTRSPEHLPLRALSNRGRRRVYEVILMTPGLTVNEICRVTHFKQPLVSHYLEVLVDADLVERVNEQQYAYCYPTLKGIRRLRTYVDKAAARAARGRA